MYGERGMTTGEVTHRFKNLPIYHELRQLVFTYNELSEEELHLQSSLDTLEIPEDMYEELIANLPHTISQDALDKKYNHIVFMGYILVPYKTSYLNLSSK